MHVLAVYTVCSVVSISVRIHQIMLKFLMIVCILILTQMLVPHCTGQTIPGIIHHV